MGFFALQCIDCPEKTKKQVGQCRGKDEKGKYILPLFECANWNCTIQMNRRKSSRKLK